MNVRWANAGWLLCAVPLVGLVELALHVKQTSSDVVPESDWQRAREVVKADLKADDLVLFEPYWTDPLGRRSFGELATMRREGYSDLQRFGRAYEVSIRGAHDADLARWRKVKEERAGAITITLFENPAQTPVIDDMLDLIGPERMSVSRVDGANETPCAFQRGASAGGSTVVPQGLLTPADKFVCSGGHVGVAVLHGLDHHPHVCFYATPLKDAALKIRFKDVSFGASVHGHAGIQWVVERVPAPDKVAVAFSADGHSLGTALHQVGAGWTGFEFPTPELDGKKADLIAEVQPSAQHQFCFEASTRRAPK